MGPIDVPVDTDVSTQFDADAPERAHSVTITVSVNARYADSAEKLARKPLERAREMRLWRKWGVNHRFC